MTWMKNEKSQVLKSKDKIKRFTKDTCNRWTKSRLTKPRFAGSTTCTRPLPSASTGVMMVGSPALMRRDGDPIRFAPGTYVVAVDCSLAQSPH